MCQRNFSYVATGKAGTLCDFRDVDEDKKSRDNIRAYAIGLDARADEYDT